MKQKNKKSRIELRTLAIFLSVAFIFSLFLISAPLLVQTFTTSGDAVSYNQTEGSNLGVRIILNSTGVYNYTTGDFKSGVFYNSTSTFWNTTLSVADTTSSRSGIVNTDNSINTSYPTLMRYWNLDNSTQPSIIFDDVDSSSFINSSSGWTKTYESTLGPHLGFGYRYATAGSGTVWAQWNVSVPNTGEYNLYATWIPFAGRATNTPYKINHDNGLSTLSVNQQTGTFNGFNLLGTYNFTKGNSYLINITDNANGLVMADAIILMPKNNLNSLACQDPTNCPITAGGISSNAIKFNGLRPTTTASQALIAKNVDVATNISISAWIYPTSSPEGVIVGKHYINTQWMLYATGGAVQLRGGSGTPAAASAVLPANQWYHVLGVINGTTGTLYINGVQVARNTIGAIGNSNTFVTIGSMLHYPTTAYTFNGTIDEVALWNSTLTASDAMAIYKSGLSQHANTNVTLQTRTANSYNISDPSLVSFWSFNSDNSSTAFDELGINNGTRKGVIADANEGNGTVSKGYLFDGVNDYISIDAPSASMQAVGGDVMTISAWVYKVGTGTYGCIATFAGAGMCVNDNDRIGLLYGSNFVWQEDATSPKNVWTHYVVTASPYMVYRNGVNVTTAAANPGWGLSSNYYIGLGYSGNLFKGAIDEIRVYNRSLSAAEAADLYQMGATHITDWSDWSSESLVNDSQGINSAASGKFMQFKTNLYSNSTESSPYVINYEVGAGVGSAAGLTFNSLTQENSFAISQFVKVNGTNFTLAGKRYTLMGADSYYLADYATNHTFDDSGNEINNSQIYVNEILDKAKSLNINVIRTWASMVGGNQSSTLGSDWIQNNSGGHYNLFLNGNITNYNETMFRGLDYVIYEASKRDIRLQLVLVNNWDTYGGMRWWVEQATGTYSAFGGTGTDSFHDTFYNNSATIMAFQSYINYTLNRNNTYSGIQYKNDPAIFAWLLANEPRHKTDVSHTVIANWTKNMTAYIKSIDTNHLVGLGIEGWGQDYGIGSSEGTDMITSHNGTGVDFATFELHPQQWDFFAQRSENQTNGGWVNGTISAIIPSRVLNATLDWWSTGSGYTYNNRYSNGLSKNYTLQLARHGYQNWVSQNTNWSEYILKMPVLIQEIALPTNTSILTKSQKARFFNNVISNFYGMGGDGMMMWNLNHDNYYSSTTIPGIMDDGYSFYYSSNPVLKTKSQGVIDAFNFTMYNNTGGTSWVTFLNSNEYTFSYNVSSNGLNFTNCSLWMSITNRTNQIIPNYLDQLNASEIIDSGINTFNKTFLSTDKNFTYYIQCCESLGTCTNTDNETVSLSTLPIVTLTQPSDNYLNQTNTYFTLNYTVTDGIGIEKCDLYIDGVLNQSNSSTLADVNNFFNINVSHTPDSYNWQVQCTDTSGSVGYSEVRTFIHDDGVFNVTLLSPANNLLTNNRTQNYTAYFNSSAFIDTIYWYLNGALQDTFSVVLGTVELTYGFVNDWISEEINTWYVSITDIYGLTSTSETWNITLDSTLPGNVLTECADLVTPNTVYTLGNNVSSTGTCINVLANNVTLDCGGFMINYSYAGVLGYGVYANGVNSTTVKNCVIKNGIAGVAGTAQHDIHFNRANNGTIFNNTVTTSGYSAYGIYLYYSNLNNVSNNNATAAGNYAWGIRLMGTGSNNLISNNIILANYITSGGLALDGNNENIVNSNTISNNIITTTGTTGALGIALTQKINNNNFTNNTVTTTSANGLSIDTCSFNTFTNNNFTTTAYKPINILGTTSAHFNNSIDSTNIGNGKPIFYNYSVSNVVYNGYSFANNYGQVIFAGSNNITINNSNITNGGINLWLTTNSTISNNNINTSKGYDYGVYVYLSNSTNVLNNNISTLGSTAYGIRYLTSSNGLIQGNSIDANGTSASGIILETGANSNNLLSNNVTTRGTSGIGVYIFNSNLNAVSNNNITTAGNSAFGFFWNGASSTNAANNTLTASGGTNGIGIYLQTSTTNNTFSNINIRTNRSVGIYARDTTQKFTISDSLINSTNFYDFYVDGSCTAGIWNFTNVTRSNGNPINISWTAGANGTLNMMWYADIYTNYTNGTAAQNINISTYDKNNVLVVNNFTSGAGTARQILLEYIRNNTGGTNYIYYSNYTFNATISGISNYSETQSWNMSTNRAPIFTMDIAAPAILLINPANATFANNGTINFTANLSDVGEGLKNATLSVINTQNKWLVFDGQDDYADLPTINLGLNSSVSFWIKIPARGTYRIFSNNLSLNTSFVIFVGAGDKLVITNDSYYGVQTTTALVANRWYHAYFDIPDVNNNLSLKVYLNGVNVTSYVKSHTYDSYSTTRLSGPSGLPFNGSIDEVRIYNRTLSAAEITTLYNNKFTSNATIINSSGLIAYYDFQNSNASNTRAIDVGTGANNGTIIGGAVFTSNEAYSNGFVSYAAGTLTSTVGIVVNLIDGVYNWFWSLFDYGENQFVTGNNTITVDTIFPSLNITYPVNVSYVINVTYLNYTVSDINVKSCWYSLDLGITNLSVTCGVNLTGLTSNEGPNTWRVYANDSAGNQNYSSVTFFKDTIQPAISFVAPTETSGNYLTRNNSQVNITASDLGSGLKNITAYLFNSAGALINATSSSTTSPLFVNFTNLGDGLYYFNASAWDNVGNRNNSETRNITIDTTKPLIDWGVLTSGDGSNVSRNNIYVNISASDTNEANITFKLYNSTASVNISTYPLGTRTINWTGLNQGTYYYNVTIYDLALNVNSTSTRTITLDYTNPNGTLIAPTNATYTNVTSQNFTANVSDNIGLKNATLNIYNSSGLYNQTSTSFVGGVINPIIGTVVTLIDNVYSWFYSLFDFAGNQFVTINNTITIDATAPNITITTLSPNPANFTVDDINLTYIVTDLNLDYYYFNITNSTGATIFSNNRSTSLILDKSIFPTASVYQINIWANDTFGNAIENNKSLGVINITDLIAPNITFVSPTTTGSITNKEIIVNISGIDSSSFNITVQLYFNNILFNTTNKSFNSGTRSFYDTFSSLSDGTYDINATACDIFNNCNLIKSSSIVIYTATGGLITGGDGGFVPGGILPMRLDNFIYTVDTIYKDLESSIYIIAYDQMNGTIDVDSLYFNSTNITFDSDTMRNSRGSYEKKFRTSEDNAIIFITLNKGDISITKNITISTIEQGKAQKVFNDIKETTSSYLQTIYKQIIENKAMAIIIGIISLCVIIATYLLYSFFVKLNK